MTQFKATLFSATRVEPVGTEVSGWAEPGDGHENENHRGVLDPEFNPGDLSRAFWIRFRDGTTGDPCPVLRPVVIRPDRTFQTVSRVDEYRGVFHPFDVTQGVDSAVWTPKAEDPVPMFVVLYKGPDGGPEWVGTMSLRPDDPARGSKPLLSATAPSWNDFDTAGKIQGDDRNMAGYVVGERTPIDVFAQPLPDGGPRGGYLVRTVAANAPVPDRRHFVGV